MRNGIPFDVAFELDDLTRTAWCIVFSEMEGGQKFDWATMNWEPQKEQQ